MRACLPKARDHCLPTPLSPSAAAGAEEREESCAKEPHREAVKDLGPRQRTRMAETNIIVLRAGTKNQESRDRLFKQDPAAKTQLSSLNRDLQHYGIEFHQARCPEFNLHESHGRARRARESGSKWGNSSRPKLKWKTGRATGPAKIKVGQAD